MIDPGYNEQNHTDKKDEDGKKSGSPVQADVSSTVELLEDERPVTLDSPIIHQTAADRPALTASSLNALCLNKLWVGKQAKK